MAVKNLTQARVFVDVERACTPDRVGAAQPAARYERTPSRLKSLSVWRMTGSDGFNPPSYELGIVNPTQNRLGFVMWFAERTDMVYYRQQRCMLEGTRNGCADVTCYTASGHVISKREWLNLVLRLKCVFGSGLIGTGAGVSWVRELARMRKRSD